MSLRTGTDHRARVGAASSTSSTKSPQRETSFPCVFSLQPFHKRMSWGVCRHFVCVCVCVTCLLLKTRLPERGVNSFAWPGGPGAWSRVPCTGSLWVPSAVRAGAQVEVHTPVGVCAGGNRSTVLSLSLPPPLSLKSKNISSGEDF